MAKNYKKTSVEPPDQCPASMLIVHPLRLPPALIAAYQAEAEACGRKTSALMRAVLEGRRPRMSAPPVVPALNREAWMELRSVAGDLHQAVRALDTRRTEAVDQATRQAAVSTAALLEWLRYRPEQVDDVEAALEAALRDVRAMNSTLHAQLTTRADGVTPEIVAGVEQAVLQAIACTRALSLHLLGAEPQGSEEDPGG